MYRGLTLFRCTQCHGIFKSHDIELCCTALSVPQQCPRCGSIRTCPATTLFTKCYESIWDEMEAELTASQDAAPSEDDTIEQEPPMILVGPTYFPPGTPCDLTDDSSTQN